MLFFLRIIILFAAIMLDATFFGRPGESWTFPGATLLLTVSWTLLLGFSESIGWVLLAGLVADVFLFAPLGFFMLIFTIAAYGTELLSKRFLSGIGFRLTAAFFGALLLSLGAKIIFVWFSLGAREVKNFLFSGIEGMQSEWGVLLFAGMGFFFFGYVCLRRLETFFSFYARHVRPMGRYMG